MSGVAIPAIVVAQLVTESPEPSDPSKPASEPLPSVPLSPRSRIQSRLAIEDERFKLDHVEYNPVTGRPIRKRTAAKRLNISDMDDNQEYKEEEVDIDMNKYDKMIKDAIVHSENCEQLPEELEKEDKELEEMDKEFDENDEFQMSEDASESEETESSSGSEYSEESSEESESMSDDDDSDDDHSRKVVVTASRKRRLIEDGDEDDEDFIADDDDNPEWLELYEKMPQHEDVEEDSDEDEEYDDDNEEPYRKGKHSKKTRKNVV